nr:dual specificity protein phosphatase 13 [Agelaius phoeniceus]
MAGAGAPDSQDPEGAGTCPEDVPSLKEIEQLLNTGRPSCNHVDEVWPNLFLGDLVTANNRFVLWKMGVTHVLNAAHGTSYSHGGQDFYGATIDYYGVPAHDLPSFDISQFFFSAAQFIHNALNTPGAKILVHCAVGVSRSASLVLAYLMINHHLPLVEAIKTVKEHRWISPNRGFLKHLQNLDAQLRQRKDWNKGRTAEQAFTFSHSQAQDSGLGEPWELPDILDSCKVELNHVGEEWPNLYIGNMQERGSRQVALRPAGGDSQQHGALVGAWPCSGRSHSDVQRFAELLPWPGECETDPCLAG